jgi:biopolymer transport protein ExbB
MKKVELFRHAIEIFSKGGLVMWPLLLCSIIVIAIAIERGVYFRHAQSDVKRLQMMLADQLKVGNWDKAREICERSHGIPADMLAQALGQSFEDRLQLEQRIDGIATMAVTDLRYRLEYLDTIVTLAPLLGLLGTVTGMIQSFSVLTIKGGQPLMITGGVGEALIATATGLCVAILALVTYSYFSHRINTVISDMERMSNYVLSVLPRRLPHETQ